MTALAISHEAIHPAELPKYATSHEAIHPAELPEYATSHEAIRPTYGSESQKGANYETTRFGSILKKTMETRWASSQEEQALTTAKPARTLYLSLFPLLGA